MPAMSESGKTIAANTVSTFITSLARSATALRYVSSTPPSRLLAASVSSEIRE